MKKLIFKIPLLMLFVASVSLVSCKDDDETIPAVDLPAKAELFIDTYYSQQTVSKAEAQKDGEEIVGYEVNLNNSTELTFDSEGNILQIEGDSRIPDAAINANILGYIVTNYTGSYATDWELRATEQEIELNTGQDLVFNLDGEFLRVDED